MKILYTALIAFLIAPPTFAAPTLHCTLESPDDHVPLSGGTVGIVDFANFDCTTQKGDSYTVSMVGVGPGLRLEFGEGTFRIACPLVKEKRLAGGFAGLKISAGLGLGGDISIMSNKRLGVCFLYGVVEGYPQGKQIGASISIDYIKFKKNDLNIEKLGEQK